MFQKKKRRFIILVMCLMAAAMLTACEKKVETSQTEDILTQKVIEKDKIPITVLVKYAFSINGFEEALEKRFPQIDLIQVGNYTSDRGLVEYQRRMEHDDLTDIVMTWPITAGQEYCEDRLIDLSGMPFTANYNISMLNSMSKDGKLYYLPGPAQVRGIVYNKTLFQEKGWEVPKDYKGFVALCKKIEASGMRSLQLGFGNSEVLDTAFVGYSYGGCYSKPEDAQWIEDYNNGKGSFGDHFGTALDTFIAMAKEGIWKESDLDIQYAEREKMLFTRQCAMVEDSVLMARMGYDSYGCTDEFALMPFFDPGEDNTTWARLYMVCYIGLNQHLQEEKNKEKYDTVMEIMEYISTPEGQEALASDTGAMYSSVKGVKAPEIPEIAELAASLNQGRYAIFPEFAHAQDALRSGLANLLRGDMTKEEVIQMIDKANISSTEKKEETAIGEATADFTMIETGNYVTDALRKKSGADFALFMDNGKDGRYNGKGISGRFYQGTITQSDVIRIMPDLKHDEKGVMQVVTMTGENLKKTLEYSIPVDNNMKGWFYYFSGLLMEYDPLAEPGKRIQSITDADKKPIDDSKEYTIAVMDQTVPEEYVITMEESQLLITDIVSEAIQEQKTISPSGDGRFQVLVSK